MRKRIERDLVEIELRREAARIVAIFVNGSTYHVALGSIVFRNGFASWTPGGPEPSRPTERVSFRLADISGFMASTREQS